MLESLFGAIGSLGRVLPNYVQGERQAIQDNWQDLQNYNQVQAGQIQNAFDEQVFGDRVDMMGFSRDNSANNAYNLWMQTMMQQAMFPGALQGAANTGMILPYTMPAAQAVQFGQMMYPWINGGYLGAATGMAQSYPAGYNPYVNPFGNLPSVVR